MITTFTTNDIISVEHLQVSIPTLTFLKSDLGDEIESFNLNEPNTIATIEAELGYKVKVKETSGIIRKPYPFVHFENFQTIDEWVVCVPIEPTKFTTYKHLENGFTYAFQVLDLPAFVPQCFDKSLWLETSSITVEPMQMLFFRPWMWHSFENGINNMIYIEKEL